MHSWSRTLSARRHVCTSGRTKLTMHCAGDTSAGNEAPERTTYLCGARTRCTDISWYSFGATGPGAAGEERSTKKGGEHQRYAFPDLLFYLTPCSLPRITQNQVLPTQWKNVFPSEASLTTNVPTPPVGRNFQNQKKKRHPSLSLSISAMKPIRDKSIMRMAIVFLRFTSRGTHGKAI